MGFIEGVKEVWKNMDNEIFLMSCGIGAFIVPFISIMIACDIDNLAIIDYVFIFSGAAMGPTGLFAIANDNKRNMYINLVYLLMAAYKEYTFINKIYLQEINTSQLGVTVLMLFFMFYIVNFVALVIYIKNYRGSLEERILRGELDNDPLLKETIENDKIFQQKLRDEEKERIARNEARKQEKLLEKEKKKAEKENKKAIKENEKNKKDE